MAQHMQRELTEAERQFRDRFVTEYLIDYSPFEACLRLGFAKEYATDYSAQYMGDTYVQCEIKRRETEENVATADSDEGIRKRIKASLFREAHNQYAKPSSRIAALKVLADIYGMNAPIKTELTATVTSNVKFYLPDNKRDRPQPISEAVQIIEAPSEDAALLATLVFPAREDAQP